jgi:hypothetical protein
MAKRSLTFKERDVTRAFRAAKKAGVMVEIKISLDRREMTLTPVKAGDVKSNDNPWDEVLKHERH